MVQLLLDGFGGDCRRGGALVLTWDRVLPRQRPLLRKIGGHRRFPTGEIILCWAIACRRLGALPLWRKKLLLCAGAGQTVGLYRDWLVFVGLSPLLSTDDPPLARGRIGQVVGDGSADPGARDHLPRRPAGGFEHCPVKLRAGRRG
jgi:hypothetical protein